MTLRRPPCGLIGAGPRAASQSFHPSHRSPAFLRSGCPPSPRTESGLLPGPVATRTSDPGKISQDSSKPSGTSPTHKGNLRGHGADPVAIAEEARFSSKQAELLRVPPLRVLSLIDEEGESVAGGAASDSRDGALPTGWGCCDPDPPSPPLPEDSSPPKEEFPEERFPGVSRVSNPLPLRAILRTPAPSDRITTFRGTFRGPGRGVGRGFRAPAGGRG